MTDKVIQGIINILEDVQIPLHESIATATAKIQNLVSAKAKKEFKDYKDSSFEQCSDELKKELNRNKMYFKENEPYPFDINKAKWVQGNASQFRKFLEEGRNVVTVCSVMWIPSKKRGEETTPSSEFLGNIITWWTPIINQDDWIPSGTVRYDLGYTSKPRRMTSYSFAGAEKFYRKLDGGLTANDDEIQHLTYLEKNKYKKGKGIVTVVSMFVAESSVDETMKQK